MALTRIIETLIPQNQRDEVAVFLQDFTQVFDSARPVKVTVKPEAKLMEHPTEAGITVTDHRVVMPLEIELSLILRQVAYKDTYRQINQLFLNATLLTVQTRVQTYTNMLIASLPHEETPDLFDSVAIALRLKQVLFVGSKFTINPRNTRYQSTVDRGVQQGVPPTPANGSFAIEAARGQL